VVYLHSMHPRLADWKARPTDRPGEMCFPRVKNPEETSTSEDYGSRKIGGASSLGWRLSVRRYFSGIHNLPDRPQLHRSVATCDKFAEKFAPLTVT